MIRALIFILLFSIQASAQVLSLPVSTNAEDVIQVSHPAGDGLLNQQAIEIDHTAKLAESFRGWRYLVGKLKLDGVAENKLRSIYDNPKMPKFTPIYFSVAPKEPPSIYRGFSSPSKVKLARECLKKHEPYFKAAEAHFKVPSVIVAAVLFVETSCGKVTGRSQILHRLSRLASVGDPDNLRKNYYKQREADKTITFEQVIDRANYLEQTFYPEIEALLRIAEQEKVSVFEIKGSVAGAFGISQFLPTSFLKFGYDGNGDNRISLHSMSDAVWSAANYLSHYGWDEAKSLEQNRKVIWNYNRSAAYGDAVIRLASALHSADSDKPQSLPASRVAGELPKI